MISSTIDYLLLGFVIHFDQFIRSYVSFFQLQLVLDLIQIKFDYSCYYFFKEFGNFSM